MLKSIVLLLVLLIVSTSYAQNDSLIFIDGHSIAGDVGERYRANFKFDLKYELTSQFYIVVGYTYNYDSKPVKGASKVDYVFLTSLGWEL